MARDASDSSASASFHRVRATGTRRWNLARARRTTVAPSSILGICGRYPIVPPPTCWIEPRVGRSSPAINLSSVDLPEPLAPTSPTFSPGGIEKETSSRIGTPSMSYVTVLTESICTDFQGGNAPRCNDERSGFEERAWAPVRRKGTVGRLHDRDSSPSDIDPNPQRNGWEELLMCELVRQRRPPAKPDSMVADFRGFRQAGYRLSPPRMPRTIDLPSSRPTVADAWSITSSNGFFG